MKTPGFRFRRRISSSLLVLLMLQSVMAGSQLAFAQSVGTINGRVVDVNADTGISGATVSANGPSQQVNTTDPNGYYTISGLAPGPYTIVTSASGYLSKSYTSFVRETTDTLPNFRLHQLSVIGRAYDLSTPSIGIGEANVTVDGDFVSTNSTGHYELLDLPNGTHMVAATAPGYTNETQLVTVSTGVSAVADFGLSQVSDGTISGTVTDSSTHERLYQASVRVCRGSFEKLASTDQNGEYAIENVPVWSFWTVDTYKIGYVAQSTTTAVQSGETSTLDFDLTPFGTINGTVKDQATNQPIDGALVKADSEFLNTTDSDGYYIMFVLAGTYIVTASAPGHASEPRSNVKAFEGETTTEDFVLEAVLPGNITGNVRDVRTGEGIADATVTTNGYTNTTDSNGNYVLSNLPVWTYTATASASGYIGDSIQITVPSGESITYNFDLNPDTKIHLEPYLNFGNPGQSFNMTVDISNARFVHGWETYLWWNPTLFDVANVTEGDFLKGPFGNRTTELSFETYPNEGVIHMDGSSTPLNDGVNGNGTLATITFQIKAKGACNINITSDMLWLADEPYIMLLNPGEGVLFRTLQSDANSDGIVSIFDLYDIAEAYDSNPHETNWNINADINRDKIVNSLDLSQIEKDYGTSI